MVLKVSNQPGMEQAGKLHGASLRASLVTGHVLLNPRLVP
jgi:hypothetical protein